MRKNHLYLIKALALVLLISGCRADEIDITDEAIPSGGGSSTTELVDPDLAWSESAFEATIGAENSFPTLSNSHKLSISYSSSKTAVATIDEEGNITLLAAGTTAIMATSAATDTYASGSASYALTIVKGSGGIAWSASSCTVNIDDETHSFPTLSNPGNQTVSYASSNERVATIGRDGTVTLVAEGSTTITATAEANDAYEATSVSYDLTVKGNLAPAGLSWSESGYTATLAYEGNSFPTLSNPNSLDVSYSSSDERIATIDGSGKITLVSAGTTSIIAVSEATSTYASGSASYTLKVVKNTVTLSWSESIFSVMLEEGSSVWPTLSIDPSDAGITVSYSSSNTSVAAIDAIGSITLTGAGSTTISASFEGNTYYKAASASYTLTVTSNADDGAVTTSFDSAGSSDDDDISRTTFTRLVTVTYSGTSATVSGYSAVSDVMDVSVSGAGVTITYTGSENVAYKLTGSASNGYFKLYSSKKQALWLSGVSITNSSGAAINNQSGKRTFVYVDGRNTLADGSSASYSTTSDEDMKGVFFSEGQLIFSGPSSGTNKLTVTASNTQSKSGIVSDDYIRMLRNATVSVTAGSGAGHGLKANEYVQICNGTLAITTKAAMKKGITSDGYVLVEGGTTTITVSGGVAYDSEDGEYTGSAGIKADNYFGMSGGTVTITNSGSGGKGIRAGNYDYYNSNNKSLDDSYISGGNLTITTTGSESNDVSCKAIKIGFKEKSGNSYVYGGNLLVSGGATVASCSKSETVEVKGKLTVTGGSFYASSTGDDAINSQGELNISGGYVYGYSTQNDAIDTNCDFKISGGYVYAITTKGSPEVALDANTEGGYKLYITGGMVVAYGGLESGYSSSNTFYTLSGTANAWNALYNGSSFIAAFKAPSSLSSFAVCAPSLKSGYKGVTVSGTTYCNGVWATSGISGGTSVTLSTYSGGSQGGGPGGGGNPGGGGPGGH
ncbi:MAG: carbohydrate-binding domain-containing protein [Bacteroidales bacterium]|nr:carbohydrate-binding domain-containing protein [Bacteroidales bacterium]